MGDLIGKNCLVYLDDIGIFSTNDTGHVAHLQIVLNRLRDAGLRLNSAKCHFGLPKIKLLGFIVSASGIATDPEKVEDIQKLPSPSSVKEVEPS